MSIARMSSPLSRPPSVYVIKVVTVQLALQSFANVVSASVAFLSTVELATVVFSKYAKLRYVLLLAEEELSGNRPQLDQRRTQAT